MTLLGGPGGGPEASFGHLLQAVLPPSPLASLLLLSLALLSTPCTRGLAMPSDATRALRRGGQPRYYSVVAAAPSRPRPLALQVVALCSAAALGCFAVAVPARALLWADVARARPLARPPANWGAWRAARHADTPSPHAEGGAPPGAAASAHARPARPRTRRAPAAAPAAGLRSFLAVVIAAALALATAVALRLRRPAAPARPRYALAGPAAPRPIHLLAPTAARGRARTASRLYATASAEAEEPHPTAPSADPPADGAADPEPQPQRREAPAEAEAAAAEPARPRPRRRPRGNPQITAKTFVLKDRARALKVADVRKFIAALKASPEGPEAERSGRVRLVLLSCMQVRGACVVPLVLPPPPPPFACGLARCVPGRNTNIFACLSRRARAAARSGPAAWPSPRSLWPQAWSRVVLDLSAPAPPPKKKNCPAACGPQPPRIVTCRLEVLADKTRPEEGN